jgi:SAM-dependent methyltransferase
MYEVIVLIIGLSIILYFKVFFLSVLVLLLLFILVLPGLYSMITGAPFLRTKGKRLDTVIKFADLKETDRVVDLGCGDGVMIREIANRGVKEAIGYEYSIPTFIYAKLKMGFLGKGEKIVYGDFWNEDFSNVDIIVCFLFDKAMLRIKEEIWPKLKKGSKIISNEFRLPGVDAEKEENHVYLYIKK